MENPDKEIVAKIEPASEQDVKKEEKIIAEPDSTIKKPEEVTKRSIRVETWKKIQDRYSVYMELIFNRIPNFIGCEKAAELLADTQEFKDSKFIKVNGNKPQDPVKLLAVQNGKSLFVPAERDSPALFSKINCPIDADVKTQENSIRINALKEFGTDIALDTDIKLDLLVIGSVAVSRDGHRIGRGNGYVDLHFGILTHLGIVTEKTLIVTTVHEVQVCDSLPLDLFQSYDVPVDIIVTPTEVIRVSKRLPRPDGIKWNLLSERRLGIVPVLKEIKEREEKAGKVIILKSEDTDVETNRKYRPRQRKILLRRRRPRPNTADNDQNNQENITPRPRRHRDRRFRRERNNEGGDTEHNNKENTNRNSHRQMHRRRENRDFCIKVSNISRHIRIKDLKAELRKRGCNPMFISWKGAYGKCYLHFGKRGEEDSEAAMNEILNSLSDLSLTVQKGESTREVALRVELINRPSENRIETSDDVTTTV